MKRKKAHAGGDMLDEIRSDHERLRDLYQKWEAEPEGTKRNSELIDECLWQLELHSRIEEEIFYPECRRTWVSNSEILDDCLDDHLKMDASIIDLRDFRTRNTRYHTDDFRSLMSDMLTHLDEEENRVFPAVANIVSIHESARIAERIRARRAELLATARTGPETRAA